MAYIFGSILFGIVGYAAFKQGRRTSQPTLTWTGVALMVYPYGVSQTWLLWALGAGLSAWVYSRWN